VTVGETVGPASGNGAGGERRRAIKALVLGGLLGLFLLLIGRRR
jgi:hypothetical protein